MARLAAIVLVLALAGGAWATDLEMRLRAQHNRLNLRVTVYESGGEFEWRKICCHLSNDVAKLNHGNYAADCTVQVKPDNYARRHSGGQVTRNEAPANFNYQLIIEQNGFAECYYDNFTSNVEFYRMENEHVFVVKIKEQHATTAKTLQELVRNEFRVAQVAPAPNVFHLTSKSYDSMTPENDVKIWKTLDKILNSGTNSLEITAILSTKYCMELELYSGNLSVTPSNRLVVPKVDFVQENLTPFSLRCVGGFFRGVDWDADDLQRFNFMPRIINYNMSRNANSSALNTPYKIQAFSDSLGGLNVTQLSVIGARFDNLVNSSLLLNMKGSLNTSNELLDYLDRALVSGSKLENASEVVQPLFAAKVQNVLAAKVAGGFAIFENKQADFTGEGFNSFNKNQTNAIITEAPRYVKGLIYVQTKIVYLT
jgi:hypothetical protein